MWMWILWKATNWSELQALFLQTSDSVYYTISLMCSFIFDLESVSHYFHCCKTITWSILETLLKYSFSFWLKLSFSWKFLKDMFFCIYIQSPYNFNKYNSTSQVYKYTQIGRWHLKAVGCTEFYFISVQDWLHVSATFFRFVFEKKKKRFILLHSYVLLGLSIRKNSNKVHWSLCL